MTATMLAALLALAVNAPPVPVPQAAPAHAEHHRGRDRDRCPRPVDGAFVQLDRALAALGDDIDRVGNPNDRRRLRDSLTAAIRASERAHDDACDAAVQAPPVVVVQPPPPPPPPPRMLEGKDFNDLVRALKAEHFDDGRQRVIDGAMAGTLCVTTEQARTLMGIPAFSDGKLGIARAVVPHIIDGDRAYLLNNIFVFDSDKNALASILKSTGTECR